MPLHYAPDWKPAWQLAADYLALSEARPGATRKSVASFLDMQAGERALARSTTKTNLRDLGRRLRDHPVAPMLVPLSHDALRDDEPDFDEWCLNWLEGARAKRALWAVFGRALTFMRWNGLAPEDDPLGSTSHWRARIVGEPAGTPVGRRLLWDQGRNAKSG